MKSQVDLVRLKQNPLSYLQSPLLSSSSTNSVKPSQLQNCQTQQQKLQYQPRIRPQTSSGVSSTSSQQSSTTQQCVQFISIHVNNSCNKPSQQQTDHCYYSSNTANSLLESTEIGSLLSTHRQRETTAMKLIQLRRTCINILDEDNFNNPANEESNILESRPRLKLPGKIVKQQQTINNLAECKISDESNNQILFPDGMQAHRRSILKDCMDVLQSKVKEERMRVESEELIVKKYFSVKGDEVSLKTLVFGLVNGVLLSVQGSYKDLGAREYIDEANELLKQTNLFKHQAHQLLFSNSFRLTSVLLKVAQFSRHRLSQEFEKLQRTIRKYELGANKVNNNHNILKGQQQISISASTDRSDNTSNISPFFQILQCGREQNQEIECNNNVMNHCFNNNNSQHHKSQLDNEVIHQIYRQVFRQAKQPIIIQGTDSNSLNQEKAEKIQELENPKSHEFMSKSTFKDTFLNNRQSYKQQEQLEQFHKSSNQVQDHQQNESSPSSLQEHKIPQKVPLLLIGSPNKQKRSASIGIASNQANRTQTVSQISSNQSFKKLKKPTEYYQKQNINKFAGVGMFSSAAALASNLVGRGNKQNYFSSQDNNSNNNRTNNINTDDDTHSYKKQLIKKSSSFSSSFVIDENEMLSPIVADKENTSSRDQQSQKIMNIENLTGKQLRPQTAKQKQPKHKLEQQKKSQLDNLEYKQQTDNSGCGGVGGLLGQKNDCESAEITSNQQLLLSWLLSKNNRVKQTLGQYTKEAVNYKQKVASLIIPLMSISCSLKNDPTCLDSSQKQYGNYLLAVSPGIDNITQKWINVTFLKNLPNSFQDMSTNLNVLIRQQSGVSQDGMNTLKVDDSSPRKYASPLGNPGNVSVSASKKLPSTVTAGAAATTTLLSTNLSSFDSPFKMLQSRALAGQQTHVTLSKSLSLLADIEQMPISFNQTVKSSKKIQRISSAKSKLHLTNKKLSSAKKATQFIPLPKQSAINPLKKQLRSNLLQSEEIKPNNSAVQATMNSFKIKSMNSHASLPIPNAEVEIKKNTVNNLQGNNNTESLITVSTTRSNTERYLQNKTKTNNPPYFHSSVNPAFDKQSQEQYQSEIPIDKQNSPQLWRKLSLNFKEFKIN